MLVGLCGYIGSGKNAVAEMLVKHHGYEQDSFAKSLKDEGVKVAITSRSQQTVDKAVSELESIDAGEVLGIVADVRSMESQEAAVKKVIEAWGGTQSITNIFEVSKFFNF